LQIASPPQVLAGAGFTATSGFRWEPKLALKLLALTSWSLKRAIWPHMNIEMTASSPAKILVVDDNLVIQRTLEMALKNAGYKVLIAGDISDALTTARREKPDLMLLDISFPLESDNVGGPSHDGTFVIQWLQRTPEAGKIPIIIISGTDPMKYKDQISPQGIVAWFPKPLNHDELLKTIKSSLAKRTPVAQPVGR
jgi:CheY-like chemotaxis protein